MSLIPSGLVFASWVGRLLAWLQSRFWRVSNDSRRIENFGNLVTIRVSLDFVYLPFIKRVK